MYDCYQLKKMRSDLTTSLGYMTICRALLSTPVDLYTVPGTASVFSPDSRVVGSDLLLTRAAFLRTVMAVSVLFFSTSHRGDSGRSLLSV